MIDKLNLYLAISDKLGWSDMLASVAMPAIDRMYENFNSCLGEVTGEQFSFEEFVACVLSWTNHTSDEIFKLLFVDEICKDDSEDCYLFVSLRWEIEREMRNGEPYWVAINEWFK
jgi:hypothetical protein